MKLIDSESILYSDEDKILTLTNLRIRYQN